MKRIAALLLFMFFSPVWAAPDMERVLPGGLADGTPPLDPADPAWARAPTTRVALYPQSTAPGGLAGAALNLNARLLAGGGRLALRLAWPDATADVADAVATDRFADAVAIQFAAAGETLPYVGMGEPGRPVQVWFWRAGRGVERLVAQGFGNLAKQSGGSLEVEARRTADGWEVVFRASAYAVNPLALAFAVWNGAEDGRAGRKRLSAWQALRLPGTASDPANLRMLMEEARRSGNAVQGERLFSAWGCTACHAPGSGLGPSLQHAGAIHWPGYLRRAIRTPAAFLVPGYGPTMPTLPLKPEEVENLVAYLEGLR